MEWLRKRVAALFVDNDDPYFRVHFTQSPENGTWSAEFDLLGTTKEFEASFYFPTGLQTRLGIETPPDFIFDGDVFRFPVTLTASKPVRLALRCSALHAGAGLVHFRFERNRQIGGTIYPRWVPIGTDDPALIERYSASLETTYQRWISSRSQ